MSKILKNTSKFKIEILILKLCHSLVNVT